MVKIGEYTIDAAPSEVHTLDSEVTAHPVEEGADVTDNVRLLPDRIVIEGIVSNTPIGEVAALRENESPIANHFLPVDDALAYLRQLRASREPVTVETTLIVYENMVLTSLSIPYDTRTGDALSFRATFQEILIVTTDRTSVPVDTPTAQKASKKGTKQSETVGPSKTLDRQRQLKNKMRKNWGKPHNPSIGTDLL